MNKFCRSNLLAAAFSFLNLSTGQKLRAMLSAAIALNSQF
jgi:hypothetical protein